jgi:hypothetical protein
MLLNFTQTGLSTAEVETFQAKLNSGSLPAVPGGSPVSFIVDKI